MKTPEASPRLRPSLRILTVTTALGLGVASLIAGPGPRFSGPKAPARPIRPVCHVANCVEIKWPANGKLGPTIIRCEVGKTCQPQCSRHCS